MNFYFGANCENKIVKKKITFVVIFVTALLLEVKTVISQTIRYFLKLNLTVKLTFTIL